MNTKTNTNTFIFLKNLFKQIPKLYFSGEGHQKSLVSKGELISLYFILCRSQKYRMPPKYQKYTLDSTSLYKAFLQKRAFLFNASGTLTTSQVSFIINKLEFLFLVPLINTYYKRKPPPRQTFLIVNWETLMVKAFTDRHTVTHLNTPD